jgi:uncharacterized protein (DUF1501 family)
MSKYSTSSLASRRLFMRQASSLAWLGQGAPLALSLAAANAMAATTANDYKALVCIFLNGGNDAFNTLLATDDASWAAYSSVRQAQAGSIGLSSTNLLPITPVTEQAGRRFSLHPALSGTQNLFKQKRLAVLANVGPLVEPMSKADYQKGLRQRPRKLFSHNDQQSTWMTLAPEGAPHGWGGRMADMIASGNDNSLFTAISVNDASAWANGANAHAYQIGQAGALHMGPTAAPSGETWVYGSTAVGKALTRVAARNTSSQVMAADIGDTASRSIQAEQRLRLALPSNTATPFAQAAPNDLAQQLQTVARLIAARQTLGMKRQVYFVNLGGFDTHQNQLVAHTALLNKLDQALGYFDTMLSNLGVSQQVTTFTGSDFGRSFTSNGDGSDHGWGGHHLVMGGAVQGGDIHGRFPTLGVKNKRDNEFDSSPDQVTNGVLIPSVSVSQYGATLGKWFGLSDAQLADVFPDLRNFASQANPAFMKT